VVTVAGPALAGDSRTTPLVRLVLVYLAVGAVLLAVTTFNSFVAFKGLRLLQVEVFSAVRYSRVPLDAASTRETYFSDLIRRPEVPADGRRITVGSPHMNGHLCDGLSLKAKLHRRVSRSRVENERLTPSARTELCDMELQLLRAAPLATALTPAFLYVVSARASRRVMTLHSGNRLQPRPGRFALSCMTAPARRILPIGPCSSVEYFLSHPSRFDRASRLRIEPPRTGAPTQWEGTTPCPLRRTRPVQRVLGTGFQPGRHRRARCTEHSIRVLAARATARS
jgi:hypothetical protein